VKNTKKRNNIMDELTPIRSKVFLDKEITSTSSSCPIATTDIEENTKNRNWTIDKFAYGPLNPDNPDLGFWEHKADIWNTDIEHAQTALCGNCAAFDQSQRVLDCIIEGINETKVADPHDVLQLANLGYCQLFKFKCAAKRSCDAWLHGGPIF
jgi:hypothetical protein